MRRPNAFTLIEMMAAAALLALVVAALTSQVGQWNRFEGEARRTAEASLYADRLLAELEESAARGAAVPLGKREAQEGPFVAAIEVAPLDPALLAAAGRAGGGTEAESTRGAEADPGAAGWLSGPAAQANPPLLQATIRVVGKDGTFEAGVSRTTFFLNPAALEALGASDAESGEEPGP